MKKLLGLSILCLIFLLYFFNRLFFLSIVLLNFCSGKDTSDDMKEKYATYNLFTSEINKNYGFKGGVFGSSSSMVEKKVEELCLIFRKSIKYKEHEAREISVRMLLECLYSINHDMNLEKFLLPYPFTHKNISLTLAFEDDLNITYEPTPCIGKTLFVKEKFRYFIYYPWTRSEPMSTTSETFEEAYHKVKQQLPMHLQSVAEESLKLSEERKKIEVELIDYPNDDSHPGRIAYRKWIERSKQPRDAKGYLILTKPTE